VSIVTETYICALVSQGTFILRILNITCQRGSRWELSNNRISCLSCHRHQPTRFTRTKHIINEITILSSHRGWWCVSVVYCTNQVNLFPIFSVNYCVNTAGLASFMRALPNSPTIKLLQLTRFHLAMKIFPRLSSLHADLHNDLQEHYYIEWLTDAEIDARCFSNIQRSFIRITWCGL